MSKPTVTKLFVGSLIAIIAGLLLSVVAVLLAFANGTLSMSGADVTAIDFTPLGWSMFGLAFVGVIAVVGGAIGQFVAWHRRRDQHRQPRGQDLVRGPARTRTAELWVHRHAGIRPGRARRNQGVASRTGRPRLAALSARAQSSSIPRCCGTCYGFRTGVEGSEWVRDESEGASECIRGALPALRNWLARKDFEPSIP